MIRLLVMNPLFLIMCMILLILVIALAFIVLVLMGNLTAMKTLARNGLAVFSKDILKDYKLLTYVNSDGLGWLNIPGICYTPIMKYSKGKYKNCNFLQKPNLYGEVYITEGVSAECLKQIALSSNSNIGDLTVIRGAARGKVGNIRHANFSQLSKCKALLKEGIVVEICDDGGLRNFKIGAIVEMPLEGEHTFVYESRDRFIESLLNLTDMKVGMDKGKPMILLQCKTDIDSTIVLLVEHNK